MRFRRPSLFGSLLVCAPIMLAQTANTVVGGGYSWPVPVNAAPGQILNLYVPGVGAGLTQRVAATGAGICVASATAATRSDTTGH